MHPTDRDHDTPTPTPPTRVMARRVDETATIDSSEIITLVLAQPVTRDLRTAARRAGVAPPTPLERVLQSLVAALQTIALAVWTAAEPWLERAARRIAPVGRAAWLRLEPRLGPVGGRARASWRRRMSPAIARISAATRRGAARVWADMAPARSRARELRPTEQTVDLVALTLIAAACGLAAISIGVWLVVRLGTAVSVAAAVLAVAAELWAGRRLARRGVRAWPVRGRTRADRRRDRYERSSTTSSVSRRGSRQ
ncbi:MAG TPA: hypothetical protein VMU66_00105 [Gaiellales bacterium]|nr:hypothetical protein [Gaiellales bacterium]